MTIKINGTNTTASPGITGPDTDTGLVYGDDDVKIVTGGTDRVKVDSSGRLLVGGSSSQNQYGSQSSLQVQGTEFNDSTIALRRDQNNANPPGLIFAKSRSGSIGGNTIVQNNDQIGTMVFAAADGNDLTSLAAEMRVKIDGTPGSNNVPGRLEFLTTADGAATPTERMRIASNGQIAVNQASTALYSGKILIKNEERTSPSLSCINTAGSGTMRQIDFFQGTSTSRVGSIESTTTTTSYNTSSDYRLKENVVDIADGITRIKQLAPKRFNFIADDTTTVDGFLAHEAQTVVPEAVTGEKDGEEMQGIDQSKLVPLLTAALQEAIAKIETLETQNASLEARLTALEGGAS